MRLLLHQQMKQLTEPTDTPTIDAPASAEPTDLWEDAPTNDEPAYPSVEPTDAPTTPLDGKTELLPG